MKIGLIFCVAVLAFAIPVTGARAVPNCPPLCPLPPDTTNWPRPMPLPPGVVAHPDGGTAGSGQTAVPNQSKPEEGGACKYNDWAGTVTVIEGEYYCKVPAGAPAACPGGAARNASGACPTPKDSINYNASKSNTGGSGGTCTTCAKPCRDKTNYPKNC
jgi:hypothetical protein